MCCVWCLSISDQFSPVESLRGLCAVASTENLRFSKGSLLPPMASSSPLQAGARGGVMGAVMGVFLTTSDTEPDPDSSSGAQETLPRLAPLFNIPLLLAGYWDSTELALALALAATFASALAMGVSVRELPLSMVVSAGGWTVSCVRVQHGPCWVSPPLFPPGPISGNTPWGMPPPTGVSGEEQKRRF